jgi:hypothetical protein
MFPIKIRGILVILHITLVCVFVLELHLFWDGANRSCYDGGTLAKLITISNPTPHYLVKKKRKISGRSF